MEVLEKEKDAQVKEGKKGNETVMSLEDCYLLNNALEELIQAAVSLPLGIACRLFNTKGNVENIVMQYDKKQKDILAKYVKIDKNKNLMTKTGSGGRQEWDYKSKTGRKTAEKEMDALIKKTQIEVALDEFNFDEIINLDINQFKPQTVFNPNQVQMPEPTKVHFIFDLCNKFLIKK